MQSFLFQKFKNNKNRPAIIWQDKEYTYSWLVQRISHYESIISKTLPQGAIVGLKGDFNPETIATFFALVSLGIIIIPLTEVFFSKNPGIIELAELEWMIEADKIFNTGKKSYHKLYESIKNQKHSGLVVFSSGSTGEIKGIVHDLFLFEQKFKKERTSFRAINFLLFDHLGGINTMYSILSQGGCLLTLSTKNPDEVLSQIEKHKIELLPTTPTFLNMVLLTEGYKRHNLSSLKVITYGTENMQESILKRLNVLLPHVHFQQTYGLSEVGILRSKSESSNSLFVKLGGAEFQTRVVDGEMQIKSDYLMLGYLNAPSPFTQDGWFKTGDQVEVKGEYLKILGRTSDLINVGGQKVFPAEVESLLMNLKGVLDVTVYSEKNPLIGQILCVRVKLSTKEMRGDFTKRMRKDWS